MEIVPTSTNVESKKTIAMFMLNVKTSPVHLNVSVTKVTRATVRTVTTSMNVPMTFMNAAVTPNVQTISEAMSVNV